MSLVRYNNGYSHDWQGNILKVYNDKIVKKLIMIKANQQSQHLHIMDNYISIYTRNGVDTCINFKCKKIVVIKNNLGYYGKSICAKDDMIIYKSFSREVKSFVRDFKTLNKLTYDIIDANLFARNENYIFNYLDNKILLKSAIANDKKIHTVIDISSSYWATEIKIIGKFVCISFKNSSTYQRLLYVINCDTLNLVRKHEFNVGFIDNCIVNDNDGITTCYNIEEDKIQSQWKTFDMTLINYFKNSSLIYRNEYDSTANLFKIHIYDVHTGYIGYVLEEGSNFYRNFLFDRNDIICYSRGSNKIIRSRNNLMSMPNNMYALLSANTKPQKSNCPASNFMNDVLYDRHLSSEIMQFLKYNNQI
jgi:hypothetical protein